MPNLRPAFSRGLIEILYSARLPNHRAVGLAEPSRLPSVLLHPWSGMNSASA